MQLNIPKRPSTSGFEFFVNTTTSAAMPLIAPCVAATGKTLFVLSRIAERRNERLIVNIIMRKMPKIG